MTDKDREFLEYVCPLIEKKIAEHRIIYEKTLLDFSLTIAHIIKSDTNIELPECFNNMYDCLTDYWFYSAYNDKEPEIAYSYIRAYQIARVLKTFICNEEIKKEIDIVAVENYPYKDIIKAIYDNPGITEESFTPDTLNIVKDFVAEGYVYQYPVGHFKTYSLSNKGLDLYNKFFEKD